MMLKLHTSVLRAVPLLLSASGANHNRHSIVSKPPQALRDHTFKVARFSFSEKINWLEPQQGYIPPTEKELEDSMAIGGLRSAPAAVARLHTVAAFGRKLGTLIMDLIMSNERKHTSEDTLNESWISRTCNAIGSTDPDAGPPPDAVAAVKSMLIEATGMVRDDIGARRLTKVDAHLLEAWRVASGDPDDQAGKWLLVGAPTGIEAPVLDPGIFPPCLKPAEMNPLDIFTKRHSEFRNYPGVEEQQITDDELSAHLAKDHIAAFDSLEELRAYVKGNVALNKLGLIVKTRNGITKHRMILDTKESCVKHASTQSQGGNTAKTLRRNPPHAVSDDDHDGSSWCVRQFNCIRP